MHTYFFKAIFCYCKVNNTNLLHVYNTTSVPRQRDMWEVCQWVNVISRGSQNVPIPTIMAVAISGQWPLLHSWHMTIYSFPRIQQNLLKLIPFHSHSLPASLCYKQPHFWNRMTPKRNQTNIIWNQTVKQRFKKKKKKSCLYTSTYPPKAALPAIFLKQIWQDAPSVPLWWDLRHCGGAGRLSKAEGTGTKCIICSGRSRHHQLTRSNP